MFIVCLRVVYRNFCREGTPPSRSYPVKVGGIPTGGRPHAGPGKDHQSEGSLPGTAGRISAGELDQLASRDHQSEGSLPGTVGGIPTEGLDQPGFGDHRSEVSLPGMVGGIPTGGLDQPESVVLEVVVYKGVFCVYSLFKSCVS